MLTEYNKYKKAGFACLPTGPDKMPAIPKGETWKGGWLNDREYMLSHGIALIAGPLSGNLECIDFDNHFGDAKQVISDFGKIEEVADIIRKYKFPIQSTVSGGYHLFYKCSVIAGNQKLASRPKTDEKGKQRADVLIETRGDGGYFVVTPTPGYKIIKNDILQVPEITPDEREILLTACRTFNKFVKVYNKPEEDKDKPGDIFNKSPEAEDEMKRSLLNDGWKELKEGIWQRPGKSKGITATLGKAAPGVFYNFSSSADPFEMEKGYSAFQVVGLLTYGGDFKRFAKELHEKYGPAPVKQEQKKPEPKTENQLDEIITKAFIDLTVPVARPPVILRIRSRYKDGYSFNRVFTLGNFSAIKGKSKSKKTFLSSLFLAGATMNGLFQRVIQTDIPANKRSVVLFDTEQSQYDAYITARRVWDLTGREYPNFGAFDLREYSPLDRCNIIDRYLQKAGDRTAYIVIDGIADLATAINDEIEATRVVSLLMKWTKIYNTHITVVIHENKNDNFATGHLGSSILKKAECIISATKDADDSSRSEVCCDLIRGTMDFDKFWFAIDDKGLPQIEVNNSVQSEEPAFYEIK
jgi:hypothetical protein